MGIMPVDRKEKWDRIVRRYGLPTEIVPRELSPEDPKAGKNKKGTEAEGQKTRKPKLDRQDQP